MLSSYTQFALQHGFSMKIKSNVIREQLQGNMSAITEPKHEQDLFITSRVSAETLAWKSKINLLMDNAKTKAEVKRQ